MSRAATAVRQATIRPSTRRADASALRLERRREPREAASGTLPASYRGEGRFGITQLELVDESDSGLGARTLTPVEPGMIMTICPQGSTVPWRNARVARCSPDSGGRGGFRIGLVFDRRTAA